MSVAGVLLAAGAGTRFGGRKLLHPLANGIPIGVLALRSLRLALPRVVCVVRPGDDELRELFLREHADVIECKDADLGMGHSLAAGVRTQVDASGWVIALGDMPRIRTETIAALAQALEQGFDLVVPVFAGQRGHPVAFGPRFREHLLALSGDRGARAILTAHAPVLRELKVDDPGVIQDVDTKADAARLAEV